MTDDEAADERVEAKVRFFVSLVQGTMALEGQGLDA